MGGVKVTEGRKAAVEKLTFNDMEIGQWFRYSDGEVEYVAIKIADDTAFTPEDRDVFKPECGPLLELIDDERVEIIIHPRKA